MNETLLANWLAGKRRTSRDGIVFWTRKERRMHDHQFLQPRERVRLHRRSRRAKSVRN